MLTFTQDDGDEALTRLSSSCPDLAQDLIDSKTCKYICLPNLYRGGVIYVVVLSIRLRWFWNILGSLGVEAQKRAKPQKKYAEKTIF